MNKMKFRECQKCKAPFPNWLIINGKKWNLRSRMFCPNCSPIGTHNTRNLNEGDYGTKLVNGIKHKRCRECQEVKPFDEFYAKSEWGRRYAVCSFCNRELSKKRRNEFKKWCVEYKGGKCQLCGYDKYFGSLDFHHRDPNEKDFEISANWKRLKETTTIELDKCDLVCANCHREIHGGITTLTTQLSDSNMATHDVKGD